MLDAATAADSKAMRNRMKLSYKVVGKRRI
jgi:hypothetical protein